MGGQPADPDPRTSPEDVPDRALSRASLTLRNSDTIFRRVLLTLEGTSPQTATVDLYAQNDQGLDRQATMTTNPVLTPEERAARRFYRFATGIIVTVGRFQELLVDIPTPGNIYVRVTSVPAANSIVLVAFAG